MNVPARVAARAAPRDVQTPQAAVHAGGGDGATLMQSLQASRGAKQASCTRVYELGKASELRGSAAWATVTALVDSAHEMARGAARGGSGGRAEDLLPSGEGESRTIYVLAYARAGLCGPGAGPGPDPDTA